MAGDNSAMTTTTGTDPKAEWAIKAESHQRNVQRLAEQIAAALPGDWARVLDRERETSANILNTDGMELSLWWDSSAGRVSVSPEVPQIPGPIEYDRDHRITVDPKRPPASLAADIQRRIVVPWTVKLAEIKERQRLTMQQREEAQAHYVKLAQVLGVTRRVQEGAGALNRGDDASLEIGPYGAVIDGDLKVSDYRSRTHFKFEVNDRQLALEITEMLAMMLHEASK